MKLNLLLVLALFLAGVMEVQAAAVRHEAFQDKHVADQHEDIAENAYADHEHEHEEAREEFDSMDINGDGFVDRGEVQAVDNHAVEPEEVQEFFETYDLDKDDKVSFEEILKADEELRKQDEDEDEDEDEGEEKTYPKVRLVFKSRDAAQNGAEAGAASVGSSSRYSIPKVKSQPPKSHDTPAASAEAEGSAGAESSASAAGLAGAAAAQYYEETRDGSTTFSWREYERATMETDAAALGTRRGTKLRSLSPVGGAVAEVEAAEAEAARQAATGAGAEAEEAKHQAVDAGEGGGED